MTSNIPQIHLLCMDDPFIPALHHALAHHWPPTTTTPTHRPNLTLHNTSLAQLPPTTKFTLIVSPANSYARMDGSFDDAISRAFAPKDDYHALTRAAQQTLYERWRGCAPPGTCTIVPFPPALRENRWGCRFVAVCPTMRVPDVVRWDREIVYECVWSLLCAVEGWNRRCEESGERIEAVLMTPMATGVGGVSAAKWAAQFVLAMKHFVDAVERPGRWAALGWREIEKETEEVRETWEM